MFGVLACGCPFMHPSHELRSSTAKNSTFGFGVSLVGSMLLEHAWDASVAAASPRNRRRSSAEDRPVVESDSTTRGKLIPSKRISSELRRLHWEARHCESLGG